MSFLKRVEASLAEENRKRTEYRREAIALNIRSPLRQSLYIEARLKGATKEEAQTKAITKK